MTWEAIAASGEWAGAIAVVVTLVYLAKQIRQQNEIARYNAYEALFQGFNQNNQLIAGNVQVAEMIAKGLNKPDELTTIQSVQWNAMLRTYFNHMQRAYKAYRLGFLSEEDWQELAKNFAADMATPGGTRFKEGNKHVFADFWREIEVHYDGDYRTVDYGVRSDA